MKRLMNGAAVAAMVGGLASPALAQDADIAALQARVDALEAAAAQPSGPLNFGLGGNTSIELYGFVRFEAFYDFDFAQGDLTRTGRIGEFGDPNDDDLPDFSTDGEFETSVRVSRFGIRSTTDSDIGEIKTQLEFDLFGSGGDTSTSPNLRLRHANVNINDTFLVGQFWTNFMPLVHYPRTADFNGPVGITFARVPQARYTYNTGNGLQFSASIEESDGGGRDPVATAAVFYQGSNYSLRASALVGTFESGGEDFDTNGITLSGSYTPFAGSTFSATYTTGQGLGNLLIGGGAQQVGGEENDSDSYTLEYRQDIGEKLSVGIAYGKEDYDLLTNTGTIDFDELESVFVNAFYTPVDNLTLALEYSQGERSGSAGSVDADRIGASVTFSF